MTDQTQSAVEAMARAIDEIADARGECPGDSAQLNNPDECAQAALAAFLTHLTASGWQIVPVVATEEWACTKSKSRMSIGFWCVRIASTCGAQARCYGRNRHE